MISDVIERWLIHPDRAFLQKPFTAEELTELVCRELERPRCPVVGR